MKVDYSVTVTALTRFLACRRQAAWAEAFEDDRWSASRWIGSLVHAGIAHFHPADPPPARKAIAKWIAKQHEAEAQQPGVTLDALENAGLTALALLIGYYEHTHKDRHWHVVDREVNVERMVEHVGFEHDKTVRLYGRLDGVAIAPSEAKKRQPRAWVVETKTSSRTLTTMSVAFGAVSTQNRLYAWMLGAKYAVQGILYEQLLVPSIRQRQNETGQEFTNRLLEAAAAPEAFVRTPVVYPLAPQFRTEMAGIVHETVSDWVQWREGQLNTIPAGTFGACLGYVACPFLDVCAANMESPADAGFRPRSHHPSRKGAR